MGAVVTWPGWITITMLIGILLLPTALFGKHTGINMVSGITQTTNNEGCL
ncbi:MAG: hypothetical protein ABI988_14875 [Nitrospirota bacterium]